MCHQKQTHNSSALPKKMKHLFDRRFTITIAHKNQAAHVFKRTSTVFVFPATNLVSAAQPIVFAELSKINSTNTAPHIPFPFEKKNTCLHYFSAFTKKLKTFSFLTIFTVKAQPTGKLSHFTFDFCCCFCCCFLKPAPI